MNRPGIWSELLKKEDWWAVWFGFIIFIGAIFGWIGKIPKPGKWSINPIDAFNIIKDGEVTGNILFPLLLLWFFLGILTLAGVKIMGGNAKKYLSGYTVVFIFAVISYILAGQFQVKAWGLGYAFWSLLIGLLISNSVGTPSWLLAGARSEMFIKTGLVLLGAEILFTKILQLGGPGLFVAWVVTPTVIIFMFLFGTKVLKISSKSLVIIIAAATSVCGVSAAIATAAATRAKKVELTLAVGMTLIFTVLMMILMPPAIKWMGMDAIVGGAWMGGTIDATGAVVAAGAMLGAEAEQVAAVVKMIQNILIGIVAFFVAVYWTTKVDRDPSGSKPSAMEIWYRFPKFIVGFVAASLVFSFILIPLLGSEVVEHDIIKNVTKSLRGWLFCMTFVAIGLESNFRDLWSQLAGGKPLILYIVGQSFNLVLTLIAAYLAFGGILWERVI
ncbi:MAG: putative sulfate exporter family transporter [Candidatus Electryonea clarkiae]|nr:putative sulfate exporter family transporter [Candidatus Electryonea clarkiae]MDP8287819.1 putative sulfate exporter family transporter [Candidatus Electryonea clarkiae]